MHTYTFNYLIQLAQSLIRVRLTDLTRGQLTFSQNTFENLTVTRGEGVQPNETMPVVAVREARHMGIEVRGDRHVIKQGRRARLPPSSTWSMSPKSACPRLPTIKSVTLSNIRVFHRMTDWEDTIIRESKYRRI